MAANRQPVKDTGPILSDLPQSRFKLGIQSGEILDQIRDLLGNAADGKIQRHNDQRKDKDNDQR